MKCNFCVRLIISLTIVSFCVMGMSVLHDFGNSDEESNNYFAENGIVCHAGGVMEGYSVTNSLEAFNNSYENGHRFFEVDISMTSDGFLVCSHGWGESDYISRYLRENKMVPYQPTLEEFMNYSVGANYTTMSFEDFVEWVKTHEDIHCLLDIKLCTYEEAKYIAESIYRTVGREELLTHFVMSARTPDMVKGYSDTYQFPYMHLLYASDSERDVSIYEVADFLDFCSQYGISSFSIEAGDYTKEVADKLQVTDLKTYIYMVENSYDIQRFMDMGADFMISDTLAYDSISQLQQKENMGTKVTRQNEGLLVEWSTVEDAEEYSIQRTNKSTGKSEELVVLDNSETQYLDISAQQGVQYIYQVNAKCSDGNKIVSVPEMFLWVAKPMLIQLGITENAVSLQWEMLDDATGYTIKRKYGKDGTYTLIKNLDKQCGEYVDTTVLENMKEPVYYRVQAYKYMDGTIYYSGYCTALKIIME